ncbi:DoxX family protein [Leuconostoc pseudomesenteroides]|jgi:thiosulfate dehydrogenase [quinone] large subunit|uniref:DoxX family protein n=2 Tax=Leuconostoc pseudomesenteroides TaxID=33968 RepID=UPI0011247951|nr:DoxX family protein [Leuconostoc pseudomesenteroides]TOZ06688.1 Crp/Fnr family transcriptional regulator [Leuconostoc pseudomesenteroides]
MIQWLRNSKIAMGILTVLRVYLGYQWTLDGWGKITAKGGFDASGLIMGAIKNPVLTPDKTTAFPWYDWFLNVATNHGQSTAAFSFLVAWGELLVGLGLVFGTLTLAAAFFGLVMNFSYLGAGVVSVNPTFIFIGALLLIGGYNSGKIGLDRWVTPFLRDKLPFLQNDIKL